MRRAKDRIVDGYGSVIQIVFLQKFRPTLRIIKRRVNKADALLRLARKWPVRARDLAANDFKYWELLRRGCERGLRVFDYGRSKQGTGSYDFKHNWGFDATPLAYEYQLRRGDSIPQHNPLTPKYQALIALWKRMPRFAVNALGPHIVRGLG